MKIELYCLFQYYGITSVLCSKKECRRKKGRTKRKREWRGVIKREIGKEMDAKDEKLEGKRGNVEKSYQSDSMKSSC